MKFAKNFLHRCFVAGFVSVACLMSISSSHAQSGTFAGLAGVWSGAGTVTLDDGSSERIRCRATYAISPDGAALNQSLTCASDSYKFDLRGNLVAKGGELTGSFNEASRNIGGSLEGRGSNGRFELVASAPGFNANVSLTTRGNKQSVAISSQSGFKGAAISLNRS